jgi:hypothetical protein
MTDTVCYKQMAPGMTLGSYLSGNALIFVWIQDNLYTLVVEQLDPIVSPNKQSSHMHRILGKRLARHLAARC